MTDSKQDNGKSADQLLQLATGIVSSYVSHNQVPMTEVPTILKSIHSVLAGLTGGAAGSEGTSSSKPAVSVKKSIGDDYIICLEDGKKLKMLKRYLRTRYNMSPEEYRAKWGLPADYPMVAPAYARQRSDFAKKIGLGRVPASTGRGRRKKAA
ncbi:MAG: MucR family transcriptional regulator [Alphaproteobacteria bacterium]|nr:MucR family transcriptional regulator [Alphaproteobacteria bacterium]